MKTCITQNVPDIIPMILKYKFKEIRLEKHKRSTFGPWVTLKDPPWDAQMKSFQNQNMPDIIRMILKEKLKKKN